MIRKALANGHEEHPEVQVRFARWMFMGMVQQQQQQPTTATAATTTTTRTGRGCKYTFDNCDIAMDNCPVIVYLPLKRGDFQ